MKFEIMDTSAWTKTIFFMTKPELLTIYRPMIYMAPYVMCWMGANPLQGPLKGLRHESRDFFGP